jgi:hypothetical protein
LKSLVRIGSTWGNVDHALHRLACKVHKPGVGLGQRFGGTLFPKPEDEEVIDDAAAHIAIEKKGETTEHLPFGDPLLLPEHGPNTMNQGFVKCHFLELLDCPSFLAKYISPPLPERSDQALSLARTAATGRRLETTTRRWLCGGRILI